MADLDKKLKIIGNITCSIFFVYTGLCIFDKLGNPHHNDKYLM